MSYYLNSSASITANPFGLPDHYFDSIDFSTARYLFPPRPVQDRIASIASSIRAEARKLKADATAALEVAKRKIEKNLINNK